MPSRTKRTGYLRTAALIAGLLSSLPAALLAPLAAEPTCTREDFASAVDEAGASLRSFNGAAVPKIQERLKELQKKRGWTDVEAEEKAPQLLNDAKTAELDAEAASHLERIDALGEVPDGATPECAKLADLKKASADLLSVMQRKSAHTLGRIEAGLAEERTTTVAAAPITTAPDAAEPPVSAAPPVTKIAKPAPPPTPAPAPAAGASAHPQTAAKPHTSVAKAPTAPAPSTPASSTAAPPAPASDKWQSVTRAAPEEQVAANTPPRGFAYEPPPAEVLPPAETLGAPNGYTIDEVRQATRGFFGTISTNLASVIEYAFSRYGRPAGYILGKEGGGAFLAGLRYGKGDLFMRSGETRQVYWHGPSVGYDFGAEGSGTLFLIYHLDRSEDLFRRFGGVDGSAYLVGGVGLTVLKGGPVVMAPIRTGVGLRLGANIGYLRFTPHATWNPF